MRIQRFPDDSSGMVEGPDGPLRRTRAHTLAGFIEPVERAPGPMAGREQAMLDEEGAWLAHFSD